MKVLSNKGVQLDMTRYLVQNEGAVAIGNAKMNARGDIIGAGGRVVKAREQIAAEYHAVSPKAVKKVALRDLSSEVVAAPVEAEEDTSERLAPLPDEDFASPDQAWAKAQADARKARSKRKIEDSED